jgi:hypothetical protein
MAKSIGSIGSIAKSSAAKVGTGTGPGSIAAPGIMGLGVGPGSIAAAETPEQSMAKASAIAKPYIDAVNKMVAERKQMQGGQQQQANVSMDDVLKSFDGIDQANNYLDRTRSVDPTQPDINNSPYKYDDSDKMTALGALLTKTGQGMGEFGAAVGQKLLKAGEWLNIVPPGTSDKFTDRFARGEAQSQLFNEAQMSHPVISEIGKLFGGTIAAMGTAALLPEIGVGEAAIGAGSTVAKGAETVSGAIPKIEEGINQAINNAAAKSIINTSRIATALNLTKKFATNAMLGETVFDPENSHYATQAITGGIMGMLIPGGSKLLQKLSSPLTEAIKNISDKYGISLPMQPKIEQMARYFPFTGYGKALQQRGEQIQDISQAIKDYYNDVGQGVAGKPDFQSYLFKNLQDGVEQSQTEYGNELNNIAKATVGDPKFTDIPLKSDASPEDIINNMTRQEKLGMQGMNAKQMEDYINSKGSQFTNPTSALSKTALDMLNNDQDTLMQSPELKNVLTNNILDKDSTNFVGLNNLRQLINGKMRKTTNGQVKNAYGTLKDALDSDMQQYLNNTDKNLYDRFVANNYMYATKVAPFTKGKYSGYMNTDSNSDNFIGSFIKPNQPERFNDYLNAMAEPEKAQVAAKAAILNDAWDNSYIKNVGVNPLKFIKNVQHLGETNNIAFSKEENEAFDGYEKMLNMVNAISPESLDPAVAGGMKKVALGLTRWHIMEAGTGAAAILKGGANLLHGTLGLLVAPSVFFRLMTTQTGRNLMSTISQGAEKMSMAQKDNVLSKVINLAGTAAKTTAVRGASELSETL